MSAGTVVSTVRRAWPPVCVRRQTARSGRLGLTQRAPTLAGRSRNGSNRSWGLFGGPAQASYTPPPTAWLAGSGGGALGSVALPVLHVGSADEAAAAAVTAAATAADTSPWRHSTGVGPLDVWSTHHACAAALCFHPGCFDVSRRLNWSELQGLSGPALLACSVVQAHRRAQSGSGHGASPNLHASEADEARTYEEGATEDTEPHATVPAAASEGDEEGTDGAGGPSSSGWVGPDSTGTSCFTPISISAAATAAAAVAAPAAAAASTVTAAALGSKGGTSGAHGSGTQQHAAAAASAGAAGPGTRVMESPFEPAAGLMAYGDGLQSGGTVFGRVSSRNTLTGPLNAPAVPATAPLGAVVHSTAGGTGGLGSGLLKAFSNITAAVGGNSSGLLWRLASAGPSARVGPPGAVGGAQGWVRHQIHASCSQPAATGRVSWSGALAQDAQQQQQQQQQGGTPTAFRSSVSLSANQMLQWWGHRLTNESGGGGSEQVHVSLPRGAIAIYVCRCL